MSLAMIWAQSADGVIGVDGGLPWHLPEDMAHFRDLTAGSVVVMGHTTWRSLPERFRPLRGRENLVLSRHEGLDLPGAVVVGVGLVFALIHFRPVEYPGLFVAGLVFGVCAWRTGRIGMSVAAHVAFNATGLALVL